VLAVLLLVAISLVVYKSSDNNLGNQAVIEVDNNSNIINPLSVVSKVQIAYQVASMSGIYETIPVKNQAESQAASQNVPLADQLIAEPIILATSIKTKADIVTYTVATGDTLSSLAIKYGVTSESIAESNSISGTSLKVGSTIYIPPENGLVYVVKSGDTPQSLATTYNSNAISIISFNDAELSGIKVGERILIPNGSITIAPVSSYLTSSAYSYSFGTSAIYGYNGYDFGYCTWYVAQRRAQAGEPVPANLGNAITWYPIAVNAGLPTGLTPRVGAVIWFGLTSDSDHVGYVEAINSDGSLLISEMNAYGFLDEGLTRPGGGWDVIDYRIIPADQVGNYRFIY